MLYIYWSCQCLQSFDLWRYKDPLSKTLPMHVALITDHNTGITLSLLSTSALVFLSQPDRTLRD